MKSRKKRIRNSVLNIIILGVVVYFIRNIENFFLLFLVVFVSIVCCINLVQELRRCWYNRKWGRIMAQ